MLSLLISLGLAGGLGAYGLQNFSLYEEKFPVIIFQFAYAFNIYYNFALRVKDQNMNKGVFILICIMKRYNKFVFFSLFYFQTFIRDMTAFIQIFSYMAIVGTVFITVPLDTWKYLMEKVLPFRFLIVVADTVFIASDQQFIWSQTVQNPSKILLFNKPEYEFLFWAFGMGAMAFIQDCFIQLIRRDKFMTVQSAIQGAINWGFGGLFALIGFTYHKEAHGLLTNYGFTNIGDAIILKRKILFIYYCLLGAYIAKLPKSSKVEVKAQENNKNKVEELKKKKRD